MPRTLCASSAKKRETDFWSQRISTSFFKIVSRTIKNQSMLMKPTGTWRGAFACENYHSEGFCLNMNETLTAGIIEEAQ